MKPKKSPGRPKGSPNKTTTQLRNLLKEVMEAELEEAPAILEQCTLEQRVDLVAKLGHLLLPRITYQQAMENDQPPGKTEEITLDLGNDRQLPKDSERHPEVPQESIDKAFEEARVKFFGKKDDRPKNKKREKMMALFVAELAYVSSRLKELTPYKRMIFLWKISAMVMPRPTQQDLPQEDGGELECIILNLNNGTKPIINVFRKLP